MRGTTAGAATLEFPADILLVEEDAGDAELTMHALGDRGFGSRVEHVNDESEALDYISSFCFFAQKHAAPVPKLILLDLKLHRVGGLHALRRLKSDERTCGIPIIVLTSSRSAIEVVENYRLGVNSYVVKPTDPDKYANIIASVVHYWLEINEPPPV